MRIPTILTFAALFSALAVAQQPQAQPLRPPPTLQTPGKPGEMVAPETVVLTIGTEKITRAQFEEVLAALAENGRPVPNAAAKRQVAQQYGQLMALAQEARKRKLDQSAATKQMIGIQANSVLASVLQRQVAAEIKPDDAALHAYYDAHKADYEQVKASHILIRFKGSPVGLKPDEKDITEQEALAKAQDIQKKLAAGGDFAAIAKTESDDTGTAQAGGALPPFSKGQMVPEFEKAVFSQEPGKISDPVKTKYGYHIIKVEERASKSFDQARPEIEKQIRPQLTREAMDRIEKQTPVTLDDTYFGK